MTTAEIKSGLNEVREAERAYRLARDKATQFRLTLTGGKSVRYNDNGSTHVHDSNSVERALCRLANYDADVDRLLDELVKARKRAEKYIAVVDNSAEREVLTRRYIMCQQWEDIAEAMNYNKRYVYKLHGWALQKMALNGTKWH